LRNLITAGAVAGALLLGGAGAALILPSLAAAADPSAAPAASPSASGVPGSNPGDAGGHRGGPGGGHGMFGGGPNEAVSDASVVAKAIGITEADLDTALQGGTSVADVAKAHNVAVQTVIDALVADGRTEIAAAVTAGTMTQAQADTELANLTQRVTDQVNGTSRVAAARAAAMVTDPWTAQTAPPPAPAPPRAADPSPARAPRGPGPVSCPRRASLHHR